jgi:hypothetical protein
MSAELASRLITRWGELLADSGRYETQWRKLVRYVLPQEAEGWGVDPDGPATSPTVDDTARECLDNLVSGLDEMMFSRQPYDIVHRDDAVMERGGYEAEWAEYATDILDKALDNPRACFATSRQVTLRSVAGLGHGCMFISERPGRHLTFKAEPAAEVRIAENQYGEVDTRFRLYEMTIRQVVDSWGDRASPTVRGRLDRSPGEKVRILHAVYPRNEVLPGVARTRMPFASVYMEHDTKTMLDEGGFLEFPFAVPRWDRRNTATPYGWCPGLTVLDEILRVNAMGRSNLRAGQQIADPETYLPNGMFRGLVNRRPGAIHHYDATTLGQNAEVRQWPGPAQLPVTLEMEHDRRNACRDAFFYYLLQPPESPNMTATEWIGRRQQMARRMGAPVKRLEQEMADPIGRRAFQLLVRAGAVSPPERGSIADYEVRFRSVMKQAKEMAVAESIQRTLEGAALAAQFDPTAAQVVDAEETIREFGQAFGSPSGMLASREVVAAARDLDAKKQQLATLGQTAVTGATVAKLASEAGANLGGAGSA